MIGRTLGHYEIQEKLGEGGMGVVWKARDVRLDRLVALKVLPAGKVADPERKRRFVQEAKAASALNHPNIVTIHDIASEDGLDFIAMEYVRGKTLEQMIPRQGMPLGEMLKYAVQIADALVKAHGAGIVHRDLKPGNIMVNEDGLVKVLDFGLAKLTESTDANSEDGATRTLHAATGEGVIVGTTSYMSPEQAAGKIVDTRSDIFALGLVLYEMAAGQRAFEGDTRMSTLAAIMNLEPKGLRQVRPDVPAEMENLIGRCLRKDRERRLQSAADLRVALLDMKDDSESGMGSDTRAETPRHARRKWLWPAVAAGVAILGGAGWLAAHRSTGNQMPMMAKPLTSYPGLAGRPSFSPDGNQVAFSWNGEKEDNLDVYVKLVDSGAPLRLTTNAGADSWPGWSPDGRQIAFLRYSGNFVWELMLISPLGGAERKLADLIGFRQYTPAWTPDGKFLAVRDGNGLVLVSVESGDKRTLTTPPAGMEGDGIPAISPDGQTVAFVRVNISPTGDIYRAPLAEGGKVRRITQDNREVDAVAWTPDGKELVFSSHRAGDAMLWRIPAAGGVTERLTAAGDNVLEVAIARQGRRAAYAHYIRRSSFWRLDLSPEGAGKPAARVMASSRQDAAAMLSPDGRHVAFVSDRSGSDEIWVCDGDGGNAVQLTSLGFTRNPYWSPDGRSIAFASRQQDRNLIFVIGAGGGTPHPVTADESYGPPAWSRDGRWIYFWKRGTVDQVWKVPAAGGNAVPVTKGGGRFGMESLDGKYFYYRKGEELWKVPVDGGEETLVTRERLNTQSFWVLGREGLYFSQPKAAEHKTIVKLLRLETGEIREIAVLDQPNPRSSTRLSLSSDGRWLLYDQVDRDESDLMLIENFR